MTDAMKSDDREPDYKAAMMYHSDRADNFMAERDELVLRLLAAQGQAADALDRAEALAARVKALEEGTVRNLWAHLVNICEADAAPETPGRYTRLRAAIADARAVLDAAEGERT